jgi:hypothetical protein
MIENLRMFHHQVVKRSEIFRREGFGVKPDLFDLAHCPALEIGFLFGLAYALLGAIMKIAFSRFSEFESFGISLGAFLNWDMNHLFRKDYKVRMHVRIVDKELEIIQNEIQRLQMLYPDYEIELNMKRVRESKL